MSAVIFSSHLLFFRVVVIASRFILLGGALAYASFYAVRSVMNFIENRRERKKKR